MNQLSCGAEHASALLFIGVHDVDLSGRQVVGLRLGVAIGVGKSDLAIGDEASAAAGDGTQTA